MLFFVLGMKKIDPYTPTSITVSCNHDLLAGISVCSASKVRPDNTLMWFCM
jgi:hypothetical protein